MKPLFMKVKSSHTSRREPTSPIDAPLSIISTTMTPGKCALSSSKNTSKNAKRVYSQTFNQAYAQHSSDKTQKRDLLPSQLLPVHFSPISQRTSSSPHTHRLSLNQNLQNYPYEVNKEHHKAVDSLNQTMISLTRGRMHKSAQNGHRHRRYRSTEVNHRQVVESVGTSQLQLELDLNYGSG